MHARPLSKAWRRRAGQYAEHAVGKVGQRQQPHARCVQMQWRPTPAGTPQAPGEQRLNEQEHACNRHSVQTKSSSSGCWTGVSTQAVVNQKNRHVLYGTATGT